MNYCQLIESIKTKHKIDLLYNDIKFSIDDIIMLSEDITNWRSDILYVGSPAYLPASPNCSLQLILCSKDYELVSEFPSNIAIIHESDVNSVFNQLNHVFYKSLRLSAEFSKLVAMMLRGDSITSILNASATQLGNPLIVIDTSYHVLCHSDNYIITDPFWIKNIARGYCTYEFIVAVNKILSKQETPEDSTSFIVNCPVAPRSKLCIKIIWNNIIVGYIIMLEEETPLQNFQMEYLPKISYIIGDMLSKSPEFESILGSNTEHILHNLLKGEDELNIKSRIDAANLVFPQSMRCILLDTKHYESANQKVDNKNLVRFYKERLSTIFTHIYSTYYKDNIIFVVGVNSHKRFNKEKTELLYSLFEKDVKTIEISQVFQSIYQLSKHFKDCKDLQMIAIQNNINNELLYYEEHILELISTHVADKYQLNMYINPALSILRNFDYQTGSKLYETLLTFLLCKYNLKQTAALLFIHRNTLTYRMDKIAELTHLDLEDSNVLFWLELSYRLDKLL